MRLDYAFVDRELAYVINMIKELEQARADSKMLRAYATGFHTGMMMMLSAIDRAGLTPQERDSCDEVMNALRRARKSRR